jgi:hypothetical protein
MAGSLRRFDRARRQLDELKTEEATFLGRTPYSSTTRFDATLNRHVFIAHVHEDPDPDLGLLAAECIHNMRAGLDNLLWSVAGEGVQKDRLSFPIYDDPLGFLSEAYRTLQRLPAKLFEAVEWCQPYNADNLSVPERLTMLNTLWNRDKHRAPTAVGSVAEMFAVAGFVEGEEKIAAQLTDFTTALYEGKEIGWASGLPEDRDVRPSIHFGISFTAADADRVYPLHGLEKMHSIITEEIVPRFRVAIQAEGHDDSTAGEPSSRP